MAAERSTLLFCEQPDDNFFVSIKFAFEKEGLSVEDQKKAWTAVKAAVFGVADKIDGAASASASASTLSSASASASSSYEYSVSASAAALTSAHSVGSSAANANAAANANTRTRGVNDPAATAIADIQRARYNFIENALSELIDYTHWNTM